MRGLILAAVLCVSGSVFAVLSGSGTEASPYLIQSRADFDAFTDSANDTLYWDEYIKLMCDLDLADVTYTRAVIAPDMSSTSGFQGSRFTGVFDGNGRTISNLTIYAEGQDFVGLFGCVDLGGQIRNLRIENIDVTGHSYVGGLVGYLYAGLLSNCSVTGGICRGDYYIGGLIGYSKYEGITSFCYASDFVDEGAGYVGGLVGSNTGTLNHCYATGFVWGDHYYVGGLVGENYGDIIACHTNSSVIGQDFVGGLIGYNREGTLASCYATGSVDVSGIHSHSIGGLVGEDDFGVFTACFWDTQTSGTSDGVGNIEPDPAGVTGKMTVEMMTLSTFTDAGWDFTDTDGDPADWLMLPQNYPKLSWQYQVRFDEFNLLSQYWQMSGCTADRPCAQADWYVDGTIDLLDLEILAEYWLSSSITKEHPPEPEIQVVHWPMDDNAANATVLGIGGDNGTFRDLTNPDTSYHHSADCQQGMGSLSFDGVNDYVEIIGYKGVLGMTSRTCMAWVKKSGSASDMVILDWGIRESGQQWLFGILSRGELTVYAGGPWIRTNAFVTDGLWHHVAAVLFNDGSPSVNEIKLYIDGVLQGVTYNGMNAINTVSGPDVLFGSYEYTVGTKGYFFSGLMDDVRIYNYAMSGSEINAIFHMAP